MVLSHLNSWRAVEGVLRLGSLSAAAQEQNVTTAAVAARIRTLEERLGQPLFLRTPGGLQPAPAAQRIAARLSDAMRILAAVQQEAGPDRDNRRIALAVTQTYAENWLPRHMPDLMARIADIDLRLHSSWDVVDLGAGEFDFAIRFMDLPQDELCQLPLLPSGVVPVCTPDFAQRYDLRPGRATLDGVPVAHVEVPTSDPDWCDWQGWSARTGVALGDAAEAHYTYVGSSLRVAMSGMGLVLGGMSELFTEIAEGKLVMPLGADTAVKARYWHRLVWPEAHRLRPVLVQFRDWCAERSALDRATMANLFGTHLE